MARAHAPRGLTLIETIVVIAVFALLAVTATQMLMGGVRAWRKGQMRTELRATARSAMDLILTDLRQMSSYTSPLTTSPSYDLAMVKFKRDPSSGDPTTVSVTYTFDISNHTLIRTESSEAVVIAENVVYTDPRSGVVKSFFQWDSTYSNMKISLYVVEDATSLAAGDEKVREDVTLTSTAYKMIATPTGETPSNSPAVVADDVTTLRGADLADPRGVPFRPGTSR